MSRPHDAYVTRFFELGLQLMDGDIGASQEAIKELASEAGLVFIKTITDRNVLEATENGTQAVLWRTQVSPLFRLLTHPRLVDSNILEQEVAAIYSFLVGVNASRLTRVFNFVLDLAQTWAEVASTSTLTAVLELSLSVLSKAIDCRTTNIINEDFQHVVERFAGLMETNVDEESDFTMLRALKHLDYLQRRLGFGKTLEESRRPVAAPLVHETFKLRRDLPGHLSADGIRHDNDHADITKIRIMPTYDEIMSPRNEYLPTTDSSQWHLPGIRGRLDREFRLLREDTIGQLRDVAHDVFEQIRSPGHKDLRRTRNGPRTSAYNDAVVQHITVHKNNGLEITVRCEQPSAARRMDDRTRRDWWEQSKRLQAGALTCILDVHGTVQFFVVAESTLRVEPAKREKKAEENEETLEDPTVYTLSADREYLYVKLNLVDTSEDSVELVLGWYDDINTAPIRYLVEFPGVLLASFKHTLEALQELSKTPNLPFSALIAPDKQEQEVKVAVSPPLFTRAPGFAFDLTCLSQNDETFTISTSHPPSSEHLSRATGLDLAQSESVLNTLKREISLIQGPPGTGKSYTGEKLIQVLLVNKTQAKLGPIICVCFTNHALDQLLEHLLDAGIEGIIRMGSRSKSERLEKLNLQAVAQEIDLTKSEKQGLYDHGKEMKKIQARLTSLLLGLPRCGSLASVREHLRSCHEHHYNQLFSAQIDMDGFQKVLDRSRNPVEHWLSGGKNLRHDQNGKSRDLDVLVQEWLDNLTYAERQKLYRHWLKEIRDGITEDILDDYRDYEAAKRQRDLIRQEVRHRCLQQANIIGVTTTGMAKDLHLLRKLRSKVVVCEEAGEVLEAHILTALLPSVEQLILIGDHLQLRPQIRNYELQSTNPRGIQYSLDVSLFERLAQPPRLSDARLPVSVLETQRRMHPSIAEMVRSTLYHSLKDAENVKEYPGVVGMQRRLFWLDHRHLEAGASDEDPNNTSHSNDFEVEMTTAMVSHLVRQGAYAPEDIAVLTPYLGQLQKLRKRMAIESTFAVNVGERDLEELEAVDEKCSEIQPANKRPVLRTTLSRSVRIATVDNFQGEEAKIVIISLVRSNPQNSCGFLNTSNRINVLLSRAKHGCYVMGNSETYRHIPMWDQIIQLLQDGGNFGNTLGLQCPRHLKTTIRVSTPDHFAMFSPDGGCQVPCDRRLDCGHACYGPCHSELLHKAVKCHEKCPRPKKSCDHACPRECGEPCEPRCNLTLEGFHLRLQCGHVMESPKCWQKQNPGSVPCEAVVDRNVPGCGHTVKVPCFTNVESPDFSCRAPCGVALPCGHNCRSLCYLCNARDDGKIIETTHNACKQICGRKFTTCPHTCKQPCHGETKCDPCDTTCEVRCSHSRCSKPCHEPCAPCAEEQCASHCQHASCSMPCAAPCDWVPCSNRCLLPLSCGHQCPSLCGENCPDSKYCQQCGSHGVLSTVVDYLEMAEYKEIDLDKDPCIFPDCGHFLTATSMDGQMLMSEHYNMDAEGRPVDIKNASKPFSMDEVKVCPQCRGSLRSIGRYGRIVRRAMLDEATKKFIAWSNDNYLKLAERLVQEQHALEQRADILYEGFGCSGPLRLVRSSANHISFLCKWVGNGRYNNIQGLYMDMRRYLAQVKVEEQPFQKVADLVRHANRQKTLSSPFTFDETLIQHRGYLLATSLLIKCHIFVLSDLAHLLSKYPFDTGDMALDFNASLAQCQDLIDLSRQTDRPQLETEGHIYYAQTCGYALLLDTTSSINHMQFLDEVPGSSSTTAAAAASENRREQYKTAGTEHITLARHLLANREWPSKSIMEADIDAADKMLNGGPFYRPVTGDELRAVYAAMAREFQGTGHWYTCERGHPFTVGECGAPMQEARCPECGAPVGGLHHQPAEGVRHADEIEELARGVGQMGI